MLTLALVLAAHAQDDDPNLWLEEVTGDKALEWVAEQNANSTEMITTIDGFAELEKKLLAIYDSDEKIPYASARGGHLYNLWKDADHSKGLWRRTTLESYKTAEPVWETVLDLDALSEAEGESWVWKGAACLAPAYERCLLSLSRGGADAVVIREFDLPSKSFVEGGFFVPEAKSDVSWIDSKRIWVGTDFGEGSLTESGYPRQAKVLKRGKSLDKAKLVYEGDSTDLGVWAFHDDSPGYSNDFVARILTFYSNELYWLDGKKLVKVDKPDSADANVHRGWLYIELREDWTRDGATYKQGSLLAVPFDEWMAGEGTLRIAFEPTDSTSLAGYATTQNHLVLNVLDHVKNRLTVLADNGQGGFDTVELPGLPENGTLSASAYDADDSDDLWITASGFTQPTTLLLASPGAEAEPIKSLPALYDATGLAVTQHFAASKDGTKVPYFQVAREDLALDGSNPTLLYGYGGFEVSLLPRYSATVGTAWTERGGVYVVANIRGGGEYGPRWHQAALKEHRHRAYEDFIAVGEDLIARGVTSTPRLGIRGGSNGGLLMGNMLTMRPDLWGAILCQVPLLDMRRYHTLLAGASWMGEYGDPDDPEQWAFIQTFSPYHNLDADTDYPPILITTSTRDDRVHPGHARKMTARMLELDKGVLYYENIEGGHGGAADNKQSAFKEALGYSFLWDQLTAEAEEPSEPASVEAPPEE